MKSVVGVFVMMITLLLGGAAQGVTAVDDQFDDGVLDPAWTISFEDANEWSYVETGSELVVDDISPTVINPESGGTYAVVKLNRTFSALNDFNTVCVFSWDSEGSDRAMQWVGVDVLSSDDTVVASAEYHDGWVEHRGAKYAAAGENEYNSGRNTMGLSGTASIAISRPRTSAVSRLII